MMVAALALQGAVAAIAQPVQLIHPTTTSWRYLADGSDPGTTWKDTSFDASAWLQGTGLFGNESNYPYPMATTIPGATPIAVFYRSEFTWNGSTAGVVLTGTNYVDDGSVIYLNGVEIARFNMPEGQPNFDTLAPAANPGGFPNVNGGEPVLVRLEIPVGALTNGNANPLVAGNNVIAVQVHQNSATSSDRVFGLALYGSQALPPCSDGIQPTNRTILIGRSTTFTVVEQCAVPAASIQWYRDVGFGEQLIDGATAASYTVTNAASGDAGSYYARLTNPSGTTDSRQATLIVNTDDQGPRFVSARVGTTTSQLIVDMDEPLCDDTATCGFQSSFAFNWQISSGSDTNDQPGILGITINNGTNLVFDLDRALDTSISYFVTAIDAGGTTGVADLFGNTMAINASIGTFPSVSFQQGVNNYAGTQDAGIHSGTADAADGSNAIINVDGDDGGIRQALLRFDNIFGGAPGQIPSGAIIKEARLTINQTDNGNVVNMHRMLVGWDQNSVTWNILAGGITPDGVEAVTAIDSTTPGLNGIVGPISMDVTATVNAWASGQPNYGWAFIPTGGDGWRWNSSESGVNPILTVSFEITPCSGTPTITAQPPTAASVNERGNLSIAVGVADTCASTTFEWIKGNLPGTVVAGQNSSTLTIVGAVPADAGIYRLRATNPDGPVTSDPVNVSVTPDTTRPTLTRAVGSDNTQIVLTFSETLGAGADSTSRYSVSGATVTAASVANNVVTLTTSARAAGSSTVTITGLTDTAATPNLLNPNPTTVSITTVSVLAGADAASTWSYNTNNLDASADWTTTGGAGWLDGNGLFGTETTAAATNAFPAPIATVIPPPNANNEFLTSYFRKSVTLPALAPGMSYALSYIVDDGAVFYVDGVEVSRYNMPAGAVAYATLAPAAGAEGALFALPLSITSGTHTIAVSVHQSANTSSDTVFGAEIIVIPTVSPALTVSHTGTNAVITWNADASWELVSSANANGPWAAVAGAPFRSFTAPATQAAQFYQLRYRPQP